MILEKWIIRDSEIAGGLCRPISELVIGNLPQNVQQTTTKQAVVEQLMKVLQIPRVVNDVLEIRDFVKVGQGVKSLVVTFKSNYIRDFVLNERRSVGKMTYPMIFGSRTDDDIVYLNEFLPAKLYNLLKSVKKHKT